MILMAHGIRQVPITFTTRKFLNRTLNPSFCRALAVFRAAIFDSASVSAPVTAILPDDQIVAVVLGLRNFIVIICNGT